MPMVTGQILQNRYRIVTLLGQGGMGAVYRAWDLRLDIPVALKEMIPQPNLDQDLLQKLRAQFHREAALVATFDHPNLVNVSDFFQEEQKAYLVMSFVEGEDLQAHINRMGVLPEEQVLNWADQLLDALAYIHNQGVIHRDIKPQNVILHPDGKVILVDFGLVKLWNPKDPRTQTVIRSMGTPGYAPLEQYDSSRGHTDPRSDLYSLAATLYYAFTGQAPPSATERVVNPESLRPVRERNPHVSPHVHAALLRALALQPQDRFQSASAMRDALRHPSVAQPETYTPTVYTPPPAQNPPASPQRRALPWVWILPAVVVLLLCLVVTGGSAFYAFFRPEPTATASSTDVTATVTSSSPAIATTSKSTEATPTTSPTENVSAVQLTSTPAATLPPTTRPTSTPARPTSTSPPACPAVIGTFAGVWQQHQSRLGCARSGVYSTWTALENFEGGQMLWREDTDEIWVLYQNGTWQAHNNTWHEGDPTYACPESAASQSPPTPIRGFGKVWCQSGVRNRLGNAIDAERGFDSLIQDFNNGTLLKTDDGSVYVMYTDFT